MLNRMMLLLVQGVAKHAEPAANEVAGDIEDKAAQFGKNAPKAAAQLREGAVGAAKDIADNAGPVAHRVGGHIHPSCPHPCIQSFGRQVLRNTNMSGEATGSLYTPVHAKLETCWETCTTERRVHAAWYSTRRSLDFAY